jgi:hypothetical protein
VDLFISGRKLKDTDIGFGNKSDPFCKVFEMKNSNWVPIGKTETIQNNLNPDFATKITVNYFFERIQRLKFKFMDDDSENGTNDDKMGEIESTLGAIMGAKQQTLV